MGISDAWKLNLDSPIVWFFINFKIRCVFFLQIWRIFKSVFIDIQNLRFDCKSILISNMTSVVFIDIQNFWFDCKSVLISNMTSVVLPSPSNLLWNYSNAKKFCRNNHESTLPDNIVQLLKLNISFLKKIYLYT